MSRYNECSRSRGSEKGNSAHSGLLFLWRKYLCSLRLLPKHRIWVTNFVGAISYFARLPLNSSEAGLDFSSSNSKKSQGSSEICFPHKLPSILCFHTDTKTHLPSGTQEVPTRRGLWHISLRGVLGCSHDKVSNVPVLLLLQIQAWNTPEENHWCIIIRRWKKPYGMWEEHVKLWLFVWDDINISVWR